MTNKTTNNNKQTGLSAPPNDWQNILWREWRNAEDEEYAQHVFKLVAQESVGPKIRLMMIVLGGLFGAMLGLILDTLFFSGTSMLVFLGFVGGGWASYVRGHRLSMRRWLAILTPNNIFVHLTWPLKLLLVFSVFPLAALMPLLLARSLFLGLVSGSLLGLILGGLSWPFLGIMSLLFFQGQMMQSADIYFGWAGVGVGLALGVLVGARPTHQHEFSFRHVCFWWQSPPLLVEVEAALQQAIAVQAAFSHSWEAILPQLKARTMPQQKKPETCVQQLQAPNWRTRLLARRDLLYLSSEALDHLLPLAQDEKSPLRQTALALLHGIERETQQWPRPLCINCMLRCQAYHIPLSAEETIIYQGCRECAQSRDIVNGELIVVLDEGMQDDWLLEGQQIRVNWLTWRSLSDFERVEIIKATDENVERFAVQVGNDTDPIRHPYYKDIPYTIDPTCHLSNNTQKILQRTFRQIA